MSFTSIITVNYNQPRVTLEFLDSIKKNIRSEEIEVILVDNGSVENHEFAFREKFPGLVYIRSYKNLGFAGGNNLGIKSAKGDYLLFLNNDTEICENFLSILLSEFKENPDIGILSPLILYHDDKKTIQYAGFTKMNYFTGRNKGIGNKEDDTQQYNDKSQETGFIHGAAMMCSKADILHIGLMDENYFLYYEELDWCEKFRKAGKKIWFTGKTKIYHKESISVGKDSNLKVYFMHRNRMLYIRKNANIFTTFIFYLYFIGIACPKTVLKFYLKGRKDLVPWLVKAIVWNFTNPKNSNELGFQPLI